MSMLELTRCCQHFFHVFDQFVWIELESDLANNADEKVINVMV